MFKNILLVFAIGLLAIVQAEQSPPEGFVAADEYTSSVCTEIKHEISSKNVRVFTPGCRGPGHCQLRRNTTVDLYIQFETTKAIPDLERVIISMIKTGDKLVQVPYGPPVPPCTVTSIEADDKSGCVDNGVVAGKVYTYKSSFDVLQSFPSVEDIEIRFIVRQKVPKHTKLRLWRNHPGETVLCLKMSDFSVTD